MQRTKEKKKESICIIVGCQIKLMEMEGANKNIGESL
jgi:hypothetical protein